MHFGSWPSLRLGHAQRLRIDSHGQARWNLSNEHGE